MKKTKWTEKISNEEILKVVREERNLLRIIIYITGTVFGNLIRNDIFINSYI